MSPSPINMVRSLAVGLPTAMVAILALLPSSAMGAPTPTYFPNPMAIPAPPPVDALFSCGVDPNGSPTVSDMKLVSDWIDNSIADKGIYNEFNAACTLVASQMDAAVYICNSVSKEMANGWGNMKGRDIAYAVEKLSQSCTGDSDRGPVTGGVMWVNGIWTNQNSGRSIDTGLAAYIMLRRSGM